MDNGSTFRWYERLLIHIGGTLYNLGRNLRSARVIRRAPGYLPHV